MNLKSRIREVERNLDRNREERLQRVRERWREERYGDSFLVRMIPVFKTFGTWFGLVAGIGTLRMWAATAGSC